MALSFITPTQSKNTDALATTESDTASTTGSSQVHGLNYSLILYLHTCLHSFEYHLLRTIVCLPGQLVNRGARKREKTLVTTPPHLEDACISWKHGTETCLPGTAPRCRRMDPVLL